MTAAGSERAQTPEDIDELFIRVWDGYVPETPTDVSEDNNPTNGFDLCPEPSHNSNPRIQRPSSTTPNSSPRVRRPLPPTPGHSLRPHSQVSSTERRLPLAPELRPISFNEPPYTPIAEAVPTPTSTSRRNPAVSEIPPWRPPPPPPPPLPPPPPECVQLAQPEIDLEDSSSLYPGDNTPPLPIYEKEPSDHTPPGYYEDPSRPAPPLNGDPGPSELGLHPSFISGGDRPETPSQHHDDYGTPYDGSSHQSTSDLSYVESLQQREESEAQQIISNVPDSPYLNHSISPFIDFGYGGTSQYLPSHSDQYLDLDSFNTPGPSNITRRPTELLHEIRSGSQRRSTLELHDQDEYWNSDDEEPDRFVNFSLLSHLAVQLRDKVLRGEHVKGNVPYPRAFTGKDIVSTIHTQISRELVENHGGAPNDRRAALQIARSLQSQLMFVEVEWGGRILQDGVEDVYQFLDEEEYGAKEALPTSVVTILAKCYSPSCGEGPECYAYGCPRKGDSLRKMLPSNMETPSTSTRESWPKTVPPELLQTLPEREINRQIIIHKLISKEEQYVKDLDLVESVFIQPLRKASPPVITPPERLEEFIEDVFHNILDVRECNMRLLEFLSVRQREEAPVIKRIGDIILGIAADFRDPYPAYIGNHPLAERRMKDELDNNPRFRPFIENCSRQQAIRPGASGNMRLDLRHFLNRPAEHLQKYPVLLQAICKSTERGSPDADFLIEAIAVIKNLQGVAQLRTFQSSMGRGVPGKWGWHDLVTPDVRPRLSPDEIKRQSIIFEFVKGEMLYVKDLENISVMYVRPLKNSDPPIIPKERLDRFINDVFHNFGELRKYHRQLVNTLHQIQRDEHPKIRSITAPVLNALLDFREAYLDYIPNYPIAEYRIEEEAERNPRFREFTENCARYPDAHRTTMKDFLNCPFPRLLQYVEMLRAILELTPRGHEDLKSIPDLIEMIESLARETEPGVASSKQKVQLWTYNANIIFRPGESMDLDLLNESRALIHTGKLYRQPDSISEATGLNELFCLLFDNYLVMTKGRESNGVSKYHIARRPIPLDLLTLLKFTDHPTHRSGSSSSRSHRSGASTTSASSNSGGRSEPGDPQFIYPFTIHHNGRYGGQLTFYTDLSASRVEWKQKLEEAIGLRKVVQESNKVFEIETLSTHTFTVPPVGYTLNPSTWNETNITGKVTCSIPFTMRRVLHLKSVTQCTMLDDFGLFLVLADKVCRPHSEEPQSLISNIQQLFAYHIEALVPPPQQNTGSSAPQTPQKLSGIKEVQFFSVGKTPERTVVIYMRKRGSDSHFHVLEPVLDRIHGGPRPPSSRFFPKPPKQDWFKHHKEFFLSCDTYDLIFMTSSIAVLSRNGFEIMDLKGSSSTVIPLKDNRLIPILQRHETCRPIGIFRTHDDEYLLCYSREADVILNFLATDILSEFGVYVNKKGIPSRNECIVEWEGNADSVAFHAPYVLLFDPRFIEIRHVETGRLAQIVMGQDVRCVWDGRGRPNIAAMAGTPAEDEMVQEAHIHAVLNHPEPTPQPPGRPLRPTVQHIFELIPTIPLYLPGSLSSPSTATYFPQSDSFSPPRSPQLRPSTSYPP
ncbi:hypothetical protein C0995_010920 [Termitomyces sp. Mi166|nr:hypothetical protein C0995_010920 [Termitomyces sp. Mi166\